MKRNALRTLGILLVSCTLDLTSLAAAPTAKVLVHNLTVEYRTNPLGIDTTVPRFSWQIQSDVRGQKQTAYCVLVASDPEMLAQNRGDLWDSGKVASDQSVLIPYNGNKLTCGMQCHWKVRVWDREGEPSKWSKPARFSIGPLESADWKGNWIWYADPEQEDADGQWIWFDKGNPAVQAPVGLCFFRRIFYIGKDRRILSARMQITADNEFELSINGHSAGSGDNWERTYEMDVASLLRPQENLLAVKAYNSRVGPAGLIGTLQIDFEEGQSFTVSTDGNWQASLEAADGWQTQKHSTDGWTPVKVMGPKGTSPWDRGAASASEGNHIWFRKTFTLDDDVANALVYVASLGYHELYVNGTKADERVLVPAGSRIDKRALYVTYDIADQLRQGGNVLAVWQGPGWTRFFRSFQMEPALLLQADIRTHNGNLLRVVTDAAWRCCESSSQTIGAGYGGEQIDARMHMPDWNQVDFNAEDWSQAEVVERDVKVSAQLVEPDRIIEALKPVKITEIDRASKNGMAQKEERSFKIDMGRNYTGWLEIRNLRGEPGEAIVIHVADDAESQADFGQIHTYICGKKPGTFRNRFNYAGGRYVTIEGVSYKPSFKDIVGYAVSSDFKRTGHFQCSNELLNQIYETDLWTFRANTLNGVTMDCPHRERLGYGEVSWATAWGCGLPNYSTGALYSQMVRNWCDVQHDNGWIAFVAPQMRSTWGGPLWSSAPLTTAWEMNRQYGDNRVIQQAYPTFQDWMEFLHDQVKDGILTQYTKDRGRFLGDWAAPGGRKEWGGSREALLFNNCVYALDLKIMMDVAAWLDERDDVALYTGRLDALRKGIHEKFFDPEKKIYLKGRQVNLAFPLYTGVVPENLRPAVLANLEEEITETRPYLDMGSSGLPVLMHYLIEDVERNDILFAHLSKTTQPSFGYFIKKDETTWPEYWEVKVPSKIHTCYTGVASWFIKGIGGIRNDPEKPGYQSFVIKPHVVGDLTFADTSMASMYGKIVSNWTRKKEEVTLHVEVPPNSMATVYVPGLDATQVKESRKPAAESEGVQLVGVEKDAAVFRVTSGQYTFVSQQNSE